MLAYKGFNKDLTCRGFQYEVGKTYETEEAILCKSGFHACLDPIDCLYYYSPESSVYYIVDIQDVCKERGNETTVICGKKITVLEQMDFVTLYEHHKKYIESVENNSTINTINSKTVAKENYNVILGDSSNCVSAMNYNLIDFEGFNSLSFSNRNAIWLSSWNQIVVKDNNAIRCEYLNTISVENKNIIEVSDDNNVCIINSNSLFAGYNNNISGRNYNRLIVGNSNNISLGNHNNVIAKNRNNITAGIRNSISAGENCFITAGFNSKVKAGKGSVIALSSRTSINIFPDEFITKVVDDKDIKSDTWYTLINGEFTATSDGIIK